MKKIFFVTPIGDSNSNEHRDADFVMNTFISPVAEKLGYEVLRADLIQTVTDISDSIIEQLDNSDLVIADITNSNPNVMFELGYRFSNKKPYLILTQSIPDIPFDIKGIRALEYTVTAPDIKDFNLRLTQMIRVIEESNQNLHDDSTNIGEKLGTDMMTEAITTGDFSKIQQFAQLAKMVNDDQTSDNK